MNQQTPISLVKSAIHPLDNSGSFLASIKCKGRWLEATGDYIPRTRSFRPKTKLKRISKGKAAMIMFEVKARES